MSESASQAIGSDVKLAEGFSAGIGTASAVFSLPATSFGLVLGAQVNVSLDAKTLIAFLAAKIGGPVPAEIATFLESAISAV